MTFTHVNVNTYATTHIYNDTTIQQILVPNTVSRLTDLYTPFKLTYSLYAYTLGYIYRKKGNVYMAYPVHTKILTKPRIQPPFEPASERLSNSDTNRSSIRRATPLSREAEISGNFDN